MVQLGIETRGLGSLNRWTFNDYIGKYFVYALTGWIVLLLKRRVSGLGENANE